jgi:hypothetical protein
MHTVTIYPLGNADTCRIDLSGGKKILIDYAATRDPNDSYDRRCNLSNELRGDLTKAGRSYYDVVGFTHLDTDHIKGSTEFFYLDHAEKYQGPDRIKINELWVPAAAIVEEGCDDEARIIRAEARHRLRIGKGIRVFSRPVHLKNWLAQQGLTLESRAHLITDAGQLIPGFNLTTDGVEFFVHSPFASHLADGSLIDRNQDSLVLHGTFTVDGIITKAFFGSDLDYDSLVTIVNTTRAKHRDERLENDLVKICHHCSYLALSPDKGKDKTKPVPEVKWMFEEKLQPGALLIATCCPILANDDDCQPPHRQAAKYYEERAVAVGGEFKVTMQHPSESRPEPIVIEITANKARIKKNFSTGAAVIAAAPAPRAGNHG